MFKHIFGATTAALLLAGCQTTTDSATGSTTQARSNAPQGASYGGIDLCNDKAVIDYAYNDPRFQIELDTILNQKRDLVATNLDRIELFETAQEKCGHNRLEQQILSARSRVSEISPQIAADEAELQAERRQKRQQSAQSALNTAIVLGGAAAVLGANRNSSSSSNQSRNTSGGGSGWTCRPIDMVCVRNAPSYQQCMAAPVCRP